MSPCLATGYGKQPGMMWKECVEAMLMMLPAPVASRCGRTAWLAHQAASRSTLKQRCHCSGVSVSGSPKTAMPALFTSVVGRPVDLDRALDEALEVVAAGDVGGHRDGLAASVADGLSVHLGDVLGALGDDDTRTLLREALR